VLFAREGADVAIMFLPEEERDANETRDAIRAEGQRALLLPGDVTDRGYCEEAVERTFNELGSLDILVNNAAFQKNQESIEDVDIEQMERTFRTNFFGYFYLAKFAVPRMKKGSCIINTGSITGLEGEKTLLDYSATKGAIHAFTKSLAQNLVEKGIRVNAVAPGPVWTPLNTQAKEAEEVTKFGADTPMGWEGRRSPGSLGVGRRGVLRHQALTAARCGALCAGHAGVTKRRDRRPIRVAPPLSLSGVKSYRVEFPKWVLTYGADPLASG
jgi:NAD(P)-dependent dehydrogenase (short-subunit alcohol dehydrogenase family)